jgi:pimeloyl-ACP methyl ester carboxylesterase
MDLRGYGESDKPPRGYDALTLAADVAGVVASLGHRSAVLVGQGWGGYVAWTVAATHPARVEALCVVAAPHPAELVRLRTILRRRPLGHLLAMQVPWLPERRIRTRAYVARHLESWTSPRSAFPTAKDIDRCHAALTDWPSPHCVLEYHRWLLRSRLRADGRAFQSALRRSVTCPVLQVHGADDPVLEPASVGASSRHIRGPVQSLLVEDAGHFPHEEQPSVFDDALLAWLSGGAVAGVHPGG